MWSPYIRYFNTRGVGSRKSRLLKIHYDGVVEYLERSDVTIESHIDMHQFPFDTQQLKIILRPFINYGRAIKLTSLKDFAGISANAHNVEWKLKGQSSEIQPNAEKPWQPSYLYKLTYQRNSAYYVYKLFIPLIIVVLLSCSIFFLRTEVLINRIRYVLTAFLTIVAFQWIVAKNTPNTSYMTLFDAMVLFSYVTLSLIMLFLTISSRLEDAKAVTLNRVCRVFFPIFYMLGLATIFLVSFA